MMQARGDWLIMTDVDHLIPRETVEAMLAMESPDPGAITRFARKNRATGDDIRNHPNTFFINRARLVWSGGYDTDFAGAYGYEDKWFVEAWCRRGGRVVDLISCSSFCEVEGKTISLDRDTSRNAELLRLKRISDTYPLSPRIAFAWEEVE